MVGAAESVGWQCGLAPEVPIRDRGGAGNRVWPHCPHECASLEEQLRSHQPPIRGNSMNPPIRRIVVLGLVALAAGCSLPGGAILS